MQRPSFIAERADSGAVRSILRRLDADIELEGHILTYMPKDFRRNQQARLEALKTMRIEAANYFKVLRQEEYEQLAVSESRVTA